MAEWIEILELLKSTLELASPLAMAEWIEILYQIAEQQNLESPLAMAEWIEIRIPQPILSRSSSLR